MTIKIELEENEIIRTIFELRKNASAYKSKESYINADKCSLIAYRVEMQYRAQQQTENPQDQKYNF